MAGKRMLERRLRMTLDFEVVVEELTDEMLRDHYRRSSNFDDIVGDEELWANVSRQIRLQRALLEDEETLQRYITFVVADEVDGSTSSLLGEVFGVGGDRNEEDILEPVLSRLGMEDARYFRELIAAGELFEGIEVLSHSFKVRWKAATIEELRLVAEGHPDDAVSDNLM